MSDSEITDVSVEYGDFDCSNDKFNILLETIGFAELLVSSEATQITTEEMKRELAIPADTAMPAPESPAPGMPSPTPGTSSPPMKEKRFKTTTDEELKMFESANQSLSTKRNTAWGLRLFQDWNSEVTGHPIDMHSIPETELATILARFYCEARPKNVQHRAETLPLAQAEEYHKNSLKNVGAAINRHLQDIGRSIDIVRDKAFKTPNRTLDGLLKNRMRTGVSRPTKHKEIIQNDDLTAIATYLRGSDTSPIILRHAVWYLLAIHFVSRGIEFHQQLRLDSFIFERDENGEYVTIIHETQQKNFQGGLSNVEAPDRKRMYSTNTPNCPVALLRRLIEKTDPTAHKLFNQYRKEATVLSKIWFTNKPIASRTFCGFMADICKGAKIKKKYTAHCLRATAIQAMNDSGYESRHIMFMSGHRSESAIRSYNRSFSSDQKKSLSSTLASLANSEPQHAQGQIYSNNVRGLHGEILFDMRRVTSNFP